MITTSRNCNVDCSNFDRIYQNYVHEDKHDNNYDHTKVDAHIHDYNLRTGGMSNQHFSRDTKTSLIKFDLTSQIAKRHLLKTGLEYRRHKIFFDDISLQPKGGTGLDYQNDSPFMDPVVEPISTFYHSKYERKPWEFSVYIQDKMEFEDLIVNIGVRFDHFNSNGTILSDPSDPNIYDPIRPENRYHDIDGNGSDTEDINGNGELDPGEDLNSNGLIDEDPEVTLAEREEYWYKDADPKTQISPRLGVSFPVTETGVVHFSYGYFFRPLFSSIYIVTLSLKLAMSPVIRGLWGTQI
ncbi:MAG: TonB-dependent receptor, partial [Calditrichales bacterium]|nr:TonB-dependent receptor [Calditrichales bacterium]